MYIFYILHTASTDDVLLRNLAKVDMLVHCNDSKISLSIFRKPSNTGLGISFFLVFVLLFTN